MAGEIDIDTVAKAYARWAPVYDFVFGAVFDAGRKASIRAAERVGGRILDVGIGTGISLTDYASTLRVVGVDYWEPMLRKAHERLAENKLAPGARRGGVGAGHARAGRGAGGDGRPASRLSRRFLRWGGRAIRHHHGAGPRGRA